VAKDDRQEENSAEARFLRERLKNGELSRKNLEVAAHCGHKASAQVLGRTLPQAPRNNEEFKGWLKGLHHPGGWEGLLRAAITAARAARSMAFKNGHQFVLLTDILVAAEQCLTAPSVATAEYVYRPVNELDLGHGNPWKISWAISGAAHAVVIWALMEVMTDEEVEDFDHQLQSYVHIAVLAACDTCGVTATHERICQDLIMWSLGKTDPIRDNPTPPEPRRD